MNLFVRAIFDSSLSLSRKYLSPVSELGKNCRIKWKNRGLFLWSIGELQRVRFRVLLEVRRSTSWKPADKKWKQEFFNFAFLLFWSRESQIELFNGCRLICFHLKSHKHARREEKFSVETILFGKLRQNIVTWTDRIIYTCDYLLIVFVAFSCSILKLIRSKIMRFHYAAAQAGCAVDIEKFSPHNSQLNSIWLRYSNPCFIQLKWHKAQRNLSTCTQLCYIYSLAYFPIAHRHKTVPQQIPK